LSYFIKVTFFSLILFTQIAFATNYLISYPRSGLHWTLYQLVSLSHKAACQGNFSYHYWDRDVLHNFGEYPNPNNILLYTSHVLHDSTNISSTDKLILLIRDYKECLPRNIGYDIDRMSSIISLDPNYTRLENSYDVGFAYFVNLYKFNEFEGEKLIIYYEDLVVNPKKVITNVLDFLNVTPINLNEFYQELIYHKKKCLERYRVQGGSKSRGRDIHFHKKKLGPRLIKTLDNLVKTHHGLLWENYLKRYEMKIFPK